MAKLSQAKRAEKLSGEEFWCTTSQTDLVISEVRTNIKQFSCKCVKMHSQSLNYRKGAIPKVFGTNYGGN